MLPLSFKEYISAFKDTKESKDRLFLEYMKKWWNAWKYINIRNKP